MFASMDRSFGRELFREENELGAQSSRRELFTEENSLRAHAILDGTGVPTILVLF